MENFQDSPPKQEVKVNESVKVFIRVRPILKSDRCKNEIVVYPEDAYKKEGQKVEGIRITGEHL